MPHQVRTDSIEASTPTRHDSPRLSLSLLGPWSAALRPGSALVLPGRKTQALLAYLALSPGAPQPRVRLMTLLWGEQEERLAGQSLRRALYLIRRALGAAEDLLIAAGDTVGLEAAAVDVDVREFERLAAVDDPDGLEQALALYRGELLEGLDVGSAEFEDWLRGQRERMFEVAVQVGGQLLARQTRGGRLEPAVQTAVRLLALEPAEEPVHRALMRLYARLGRRAAALRQYQLCVEVLRREHRVEPEAETTELYLEILQGHAVIADHGAPPRCPPWPNGGRRRWRPGRRGAAGGPRRRDGALLEALATRGRRRPSRGDRGRRRDRQDPSARRAASGGAAARMPAAVGALLSDRAGAAVPAVHRGASPGRTCRRG